MSLYIKFPFNQVMLVEVGLSAVEAYLGQTEHVLLSEQQ